MGIWILEGEHDSGSGAVLISSCSMRAFGPVFTDREEAELFLRWHEQGFGDRINWVADIQLDARYAKFKKMLGECKSCGELMADDEGLCSDCLKAREQHEIRMTEDPVYAESVRQRECENRERDRVEWLEAYSEGR